MLAALTLVSGVLAVSTRRIFRAAIFLLFSLTGIAGLFFWMQYDFIAAVQIVIYVGGITVLIIFSIFLTQKSGKEMAKPVTGRSLIAAFAVVAGFAFTSYLIDNNGFAATGNQAFSADVAAIGTQMLSTTQHGYVLPFEVVSMLLLAAMVGCIVIAMKDKTASANEKPLND